MVAHDAPRGSTEASKAAQEASQTSPRPPKRPLIWPHDGLRHPQNGLKVTPRRPKRPPHPSSFSPFPRSPFPPPSAPRKLSTTAGGTHGPIAWRNPGTHFNRMRVSKRQGGGGGSPLASSMRSTCEQPSSGRTAQDKPTQRTNTVMRTSAHQDNDRSAAAALRLRFGNPSPCLGTLRRWRMPKAVWRGFCTRL